MPSLPVEFYLGVHRPHWLEDSSVEGVPLFVSARRIRYHRESIRSRTRWALDSGGFTEIKMFGRWTVSPQQYAKEARNHFDDIGKMDYCCCQDWMCEPEMIQKTGLSVVEHQRLSTQSFLELRDLDAELPWLPVIQGFSPDQYWQHVDQFDRAGVDLTKERLVGVGSVCRRQQSDEMFQVIQALYRLGVRLHGFGISTPGLLRVGSYLASADSMAWSFRARFRPDRLPGCPHPSCQNCLPYALDWRRKLLRRLANVL